MEPVDSNTISEIGYLSDENTLFIRFRRDGDLYCYFLVPDDVYEGLLSAPSKGSYFDSVIRDHYPFRQM